MELKLVGWTQLDYDALEATGYIDYWGRPDEDDVVPVEDVDELHEAAGRGCYLSNHRPNPATAANATYLAHIQDVAHESVFGHGHVTVHVSGVSRALLLELERHQQHMNLNLSVLSQRYVDQHQVGVVTPPLFSDDQAALLREHWELSLERYDRVYHEMREAGHDVKAARGAARAFLPEATETRFFLTLSIRAVRDVVRKRAVVAGADEEIRLFAVELARVVSTVAPNSMQDITRELNL